MTAVDAPARLSSDLVYAYTDPHGRTLYEVVRRPPKQFRQRQPDGNGGHVWSLDGIARVPYRWPELAAAINAGRPVYVVEGEKDADRLAGCGLAATTSAGGANWPWPDEWAEHFRGAAQVVVLADNDGPGVTAARQRASVIARAVTDVRVVDALPGVPSGGDVSDWLDRGGQLEELFAIAEAAPRWTPDGEAPTIDASLHPVDLGAVLDGSARQPVPHLLIREDGVGLFYAGMVNGLHSDSGVGKGWLVCHLIGECARRGRRTLYVDLEDTAESVTARLGLLGLDAGEIVASLVYVRPQVPLDDDAVAHLCRIVGDAGVDVVVIDSLGEAFGLEGINEDRDAEVGPWLRRVARRLAETGAAVVLVDHSTKAADNPLHPSGSKRKRAAITGASYLVEASPPLVKGAGGRLRLTCAKDRHGTHRRGDVVAELVMAPAGDERIDTTLVAVTPRPERSRYDGPTQCMAVVLGVFAALGPDMELSKQSTYSKVRALGHSFADRTIAKALDRLALDGHLRYRQGARRADLYSLNPDRPVTSDDYPEAF